MVVLKCCLYATFEHFFFFNILAEFFLQCMTYAGCLLLAACFRVIVEASDLLKCAHRPTTLKGCACVLGWGLLNNVWQARRLSFNWCCGHALFSLQAPRVPPSPPEPPWNPLLRTHCVCSAVLRTAFRFPLSAPVECRMSRMCSPLLAPPHKRS